MSKYLSTEQAAEYLGIKERKLYDLAASGEVPCSKVTGKWLFPRAALDRWVEAGLSRPHGFQATLPPAIVGGSHDPLLEWALRQSASGLAVLSVGSEAGLQHLCDNEVAMATIHLHRAGEADANVATVLARPELHDAVMIAFARREQGLMLSPALAKMPGTLRQAAEAGLRFGRRQAGAGAEGLLRKLAGEAGLEDNAPGGAVYATGEDLAFAIRAGEAEAGIGTRAVALSQGLQFVPLAWERFDLVMRHRSYFQPGAQALLRLMQGAEFHRHAAILGGLDTTDAGTIRLAR